METIVINGTTEQGLAAYEPFRAQLAEMKATNANAVFHYETPKGNAAARSHIFGIRKVRAALESARKDAKAFFLEQGRKVDSEAKEIQSELDAMIAVHEAPLLEIEEREKARIAAIRERIARIVDFQSIGERNTAQAIHDSIIELLAVNVNDSFAEFKVEAAGQHALSMQHLNTVLAVAKKREAEEAELERLRKEEAARQQKEREDKIAADAAADATRKAEERAEADRIEAERLHQEEIDRKDREAKAEKDRADKIERDRIEAERKAESDRLAREADEAHRAEVIAAAVAELSTYISLNDAREAIDAIVAGKIPNVKVVF